MAAAMAPMPSIEGEPGLAKSASQLGAKPAEQSSESKPVAPVTPPATDESSKDHHSNASELSDLDLDDDDDEEEIEPDHYYDGGKIPVFKPTMDQFRSFKKFVAKIDKYGMKSGIVKIIPPKEWTDSLSALDEAVKNIRIKNPITQDFIGNSGCFTQQNVEKQRSYNLPQWKSLTEESQHQPPAKRGERRRNQAPVRSANGTRAATAAAGEDGRPRRPGRPRKSGLAQVETNDENENEEADHPEAPPTPTSPGAEVVEPETKRGRPSAASRVKGAKPGKKSSPRPKSKGGKKSVAERRKYNTAQTNTEVDEAAFRDFDYRFHHNDEFTPERCKELEEKYWKGLTFAPPMYGGDMPGSLFDESTTSWNVAHLENVLDVLGQKVPGVNTTYLYLGMWKATFAWHLEDVDLYSINYIHFGAPKQWYSISQEDARRFETAMKKFWPNDAKNCSQFLRHKTYLISPDRLEKEHNVKVNKLVHNEGEFVITFPYGYHSGYNLGYNCAESVNFATESWLDYGRIAKKCDCEADSVWIDVAQIERRLRGEPTPEYYEETDEEDEMDDGADHLLSPPSSVKGRPKGAGKKRKRAEKDQGKKVVKKIKIRLPTYQPCVLCPNHIPTEQLLPTDTGKQAHRCCALYTPETRIVERDGRDMVCNINSIARARLDLKCNFCRSKSGTCFQCSARKCTRAFHATCAPPAGVQADFGPTAVYGTDGTEYATEDWDFRCKFHRTRRPKTITPEGLESNTFLRKHAQSQKVGDIAQLQYVGGEVFAGTIAENRHSERSFMIDILPEGDRIEVEWRYLVVLDPEDSQRRKPSPDAQPLPEHMSEDIGVDGNVEFGPPQEGDFFTDAMSTHKWSEFNIGFNPHNREQVKIDFTKPDRLWYYLGRNSTEARSQFTEDPRFKRNNPKSSYLETVKLPSNPLQQRPSVQSHSTNPNFHALNAISRQAGGPTQPPNFRFGRPYQPPGQLGAPYMSQQVPRPPSSSSAFPNNPYAPGGQHHRYHSQHTPSTPNTMHRPWSANAQSPPNLRAPTPSPITSPPTMHPHCKRHDEEHKARLAKYPYIQLSRQHQEDQYPYGYTSPYPSETEYSKPYVEFLNTCDIPSSKHPQGIQWSHQERMKADPDRACLLESKFQPMHYQAPTAAMMEPSIRRPSGSYQTQEEFKREVSSEAMKLDRQMSRGASIPGGGE